MRSPSKPVLVSATVLVVGAITAAYFVVRDEDSGAGSAGGIELAGMQLSDKELRSMSAEAMGEPLEKVALARPSLDGRDLAGSLQGRTRSFDLEAKPVRWEYREGQQVAAWAYNGIVPGPTLRANEGDTVRVTFTNRLPVATTVHWHGVDVPWTQDGVPGVTQKAVKPGASYIYTFTATPAGTRWYHTHGSKLGDEAAQLDMGLSGAFVIAPRSPKADVDRVLLLDDWQVGSRGYNAAMMTGAGHGAHNAAYNVFTINGQSAPDVPDIVVKRGQRVRLRFINGSTMNYHPMHLHGHQFRIVALDGNPVPNPVTRNVALLAPGETADVEFVANNPGVWMLHCHDLHHADGGMHMLVRYEGFKPVADDGSDHGSGH